MDESRVETAAITEMAQYKDFDVSAYMTERFEMYGGESEEVELSFPQNLIELAVERFGKESLRTKGDTGIVRTRIQVSKTFFSWLTMFEGKVKIQ